MSEPSARLIEADPNLFEPVAFTTFIAPIVENGSKAKVTRVCNGLRILNNMYRIRLDPKYNRAESFFSRTGFRLPMLPGSVEHPFLLHTDVDYSNNSSVFRHVYKTHYERISVIVGALYRIAGANKLTDATSVGIGTADVIVDLLNEQTLLQQSTY